MMHDRFYMHTSQVNDKMGKKMSVVIDPSSTSDYFQQISERKLLNVMGKQSKDVKDHINEACMIDATVITTAMKQNDAPNVVETMVPIPYNLQKLTIDPDTHAEENRIQCGYVQLRQ